MKKPLHNLAEMMLLEMDNDKEVRVFLEGLTLSNLKENGDSMVFMLKNKITRFFNEDKYDALYYTKGNIAALNEFKELQFLVKNKLEGNIKMGKIPGIFNEVVVAFDYLYKNRNEFQRAFKNGNELVMLVYFSVLHAIIFGAVDAVLCNKSEMAAMNSLYIQSLAKFNGTVKNGTMDAILKKEGDYFIGGTMLISGAILFLLLGIKDITYYFYSFRISIADKLSYVKEAIELNQEVVDDKNITKKQKDIASKLAKVIEKIKVEDIEANEKAKKMKVEDKVEMKESFNNRKELIDLL